MASPFTIGSPGQLSSSLGSLGTLPPGVQDYAFTGLDGLPWATVSSAFFPQFQPNPNLWDKLCYYRLLVIDTFSGNNVVQGDGNGTSRPEEIQIYPLGDSTLAFIPMDSSWEIRFPITPQQLSITDSFAINTSATLRGILEEHSGLRFKNIAVKGTFGVWPGRPSIAPQPETPGALQSIFGNTVQSAQNVATQFSSILNNITTGSNASKPINYRPDNTNPSEQTQDQNETDGFGTGYYQTIMLQQFLEQYVEAKRNPANAGWRLVFDIPKQNQSFIVTPMSFNWEESVSHPLEIDYTLQFKAWRRINLNQKPGLAALQVTTLSPGVLQQILNTISAAQNTAAAAYNLIGAVRSDVDNILNIIRQTGIFVKQLAGVALVASDLSSQIVGDAKSTISNFLSTLNINNLTGNAVTDSVTIQKLAQIQQLNRTNEGLSSSAVANGQLGNSASVSSYLKSVEYYVFESSSVSSFTWSGTSK